MKVFFDNCTSPVLAATIDGFMLHRGGRGYHIKDLACGRNASDVTWISHLRDTSDGWMVVTGDHRIHRNRAERAAFRQASLRGFVLATGYQKLPVHQQAAFLLWRWPDIENLIDIAAAPFLFELPVNRAARIRQLPL